MPFDKALGELLGGLLPRYRQEEKVRAAVAHNIHILKCVHGGLEMALKNQIQFDPRGDYWRLPERRLVVEYLAQNWTGKVGPAEVVRDWALHLVSICDRARHEGAVDSVSVEEEDVLFTVQLLLDWLPGKIGFGEWSKLKQYWKKLPDTAEIHFLDFLRSVDSLDKLKSPFKIRQPWLAYLGSNNREELLKHQRFFYGYANLWNMTNAYRHAGAQAMAPVLQNTSVGDILTCVKSWSESDTLVETRFETLGKDDEDDKKQDRRLYAPVMETYGFISLNRSPFYNSLAEQYRKWFDVGDAVDGYSLTGRVGTLSREWLKSQGETVVQLQALFGRLLEKHIETTVSFESVDGINASKALTGTSHRVVDATLLNELDSAALARLSQWSEFDKAAAVLHLLLDTRLYGAPVATTQAYAVAAEGPVLSESPALADGGGNVLHDSLHLPEGLMAPAELALSYLRAGFHVMFAGAPGTGKTTVAQFVGYAWDKGEMSVPGTIPRKDAPLTTVANSAWSPFHTIGGLVPDGAGFRVHTGIFIDDSSASSSEWSLRNGAIVLDEMNRADLDRCIGDLYPLLSNSVDEVRPAGLPSVARIRNHQRFRVLATVNDATLDDIVFPISEGLARRFVRIELRGPTRADLLAYLGVSESSDTGREGEARRAVDSLFVVINDSPLLVKEEGDDRLSFGAGYFSLLKNWVLGRLDLPTQTYCKTDEESAFWLVTEALRCQKKGEAIVTAISEMKKSK